jgi:hypothetical protein
MKIFNHIITALLILSFNSFNPTGLLAQKRVAERIYLATDRGAYIAGEDLWLSAYCVDISGATELSNLSSVAYFELHNINSVALVGKIALSNGRGSGHINLPPGLPTGNYLLRAYTKQMLNEESPIFFEKIIPIYNVLSNERVPGIEIVENTEHRESLKDLKSGTSLTSLGQESLIDARFGVGGKVIETNSTVPVTLINNSKEMVSLSISVFKMDSIHTHISPGMSSYFGPLSSESITFTDKHTPEYEGEIIKGRVNCQSGTNLKDRIVFLSAAGGESDIYTSYVDSLGLFSFYTNSIYGDREIILEIPTADSSSLFTFELFDPFIKRAVADIPGLKLAERIEHTLRERSIEMQIGRRFGIDTLYHKMKINRDPLLRTKPIVYRLDDYTRFPVMQEVVIEYVPELRFRRLDGKPDLQMKIDESFNAITFSRGTTLVLIDGIPVFNHSNLLNYDPLKVKTLSIYPAKYFIGIASFDGIASFRTYKGDYSGLSFDKNVRILDYQGVLYPSKMTASGLDSIKNFPDLRSLLYWDPQIELSSRENIELIVKSSSLPGTYKLIIEGITSGGETLVYSTEFLVK